MILAEVLPNMNAPLLAEAGLRLTYSIGLVAGVGFLGFATTPSGRMGADDLREPAGAARAAVAVLAPVIIIGVFTIGTNLMADGIARLRRDEVTSGQTLLEKTRRMPKRCAVSDLRVALAGVTSASTSTTTST